MKKIFAVVLFEPNLEVEKRLKEQYQTQYKYTDTFYLVALDQTVVTEEIAEAIGIKGENRVENSSGVVFKMNSAYSGFTSRTLWEWLETVLEGN